MNSNEPLEFTVKAVVLGLIIGIVMTAANVYLGLYAGMTVSASIPAAVIAMGIFKGILKEKGVHQSNIVQTMASAGESLAAGIIFTLPALVLIGAWKEFQFWPTTFIAMTGGLLGVIFMIPLRRALIIDDKELTYPEGVACATVLEAGGDESKGGFATIMKGLALGGLFKFIGHGLGLFKGTVERAFFAGDRVWYFGGDISPALMAVGYIVKLEVALLVLSGGVMAWFIGIPILGLTGELAAMDSLDAAWTLWSTQIRYLGVGAMLTGGLWSIFSVRKGISKGVEEIQKTYSRGKQNQTVSRIEQDLGLIPLMVIFSLSIVVMFFLYKSLIGSLGYTILTTVLMVIASFLFVAVSSYIVGLVGSSNNPVSGMTISALLGTSAFFLVLGFEGDNAILATLGVAAVVCCAACTAGDCSQDLKTGAIIGATPKYQQMAQIIGVTIPAFVMAPVLSLLHEAYVIGEGLKAPQASLFASITKALFGKGELPYNLIIIGAILGALIIFIDSFLQKRNSKIRLHLMPMAVGIYLPITLAIPMLVGALIRHFADKTRGEISEHTDNGILLSSGLIAGEAIVGVMLAMLLTLGLKLEIQGVSSLLKDGLSLVGIFLIAFYLKKKSVEK